MMFIIIFHPSYDRSLKLTDALFCDTPRSSPVICVYVCEYVCLVRWL